MSKTNFLGYYDNYQKLALHLKSAKQKNTK